jgi:hypothetical protein
MLIIRFIRSPRLCAWVDTAGWLSDQYEMRMPALIECCVSATGRLSIRPMNLKAATLVASAQVVAEVTAEATIVSRARYLHHR